MTPLMTTSTFATLQIREFGTASLFAMLVVSTLFFAFYLIREWREAGPWSGRYKRFRTDANQAAIGWFTASLGAVLKNGAALWVLHVSTSGHHTVSTIVPLLYIAGTLIALWGMVCLMHALTRGSWYRGQWTFMIGGALAFGAAWILL